MLCGFRLELASRLNEWKPRDVHEKDVLTTDLIAQLAKSLQERLGLDVTDRPADLHQDDFSTGFLRNKTYPAFDLIGDVGDHLDRAAEEVAAPLLPDDLGVDLPLGTGAAQADVNEAL
jgi:hypothetical protein